MKEGKKNKTQEKIQKSDDTGKYYSFKNRFRLNNNNALKNETNEKNEKNSKNE